MENQQPELRVIVAGAIAAALVIWFVVQATNGGTCVKFRLYEKSDIRWLLWGIAIVTALSAIAFGLAVAFDWY
jgi:hypothetical protein